VNRWFRVTCVVFGGIIFLWAAVADFIQLFRCHPISGQWQPQGAVCLMEITEYNIVINTPTIIFSAITLLLPVPSVWKLSLKTYQKFIVCGVFLLGSLGIVISIIRLWLVVIDSHQDMTWDNTPMFYWSVAEPVAGLFCCSVPAYGPFIRLVRKKILGLSKGSSPSGSGQYVREIKSSEGSDGEGSKSGGFSRTEEIEG